MDVISKDNLRRAEALCDYCHPLQQPSSPMRPATIASNDAGSGIFASILITKAAVATFNISPFLIGSYIDRLGMSAAQAGRVLSCEILALALSNAIACVWLRGFDYRWLAQRLLLALIALNISCIFAGGYGVLLTQRIVVGAVEGALLAVGFGLLGTTSQPERNFGYYFAVSLTVGAINVRVLPLFLETAGVAGLFTNLCLYAGIALAGSFWLHGGASTAPRAAHVHDHASRSQFEPAVLSTTGLIALLAANYLYFVGQGGVWSFFERLGQQHALPLADITSALALSLLAGVVGGISSSLLNLRLGRVLPLIAAIAMASVGVGVLWGSPGIVAFAVAACLFNFANNFGHPYILGLAARIDGTGRLTILSGALHTAGQATGPFIVGLLVVPPDFTNALWVGMGMFAVTAVLIATIPVSSRVYAARRGTQRPAIPR